MNVFIDNPDMLGVAAAFLTQIGARHLVFNFSAVQQKIITHPVTQSIILFGMFYLSTRRLVFALSLLVVYYLLLFVLINEKHPLNLIPRQILISEGYIDPHDKSPIEMYRENINLIR